MPNHASITLIGHIGEPKISKAGEHPVARFGLAVSRKRKESESTTWWNCTCWRKDAEFVEKYIKKGALLMVEGEPYEEEYEGKKYLKVEVRRVINLTPRDRSEAPSGDEVLPKSLPAKTGPVGDDEAPF